MEKSRKRVWLLIGTVMILAMALGITAAFAQEGEEPAAPDVVPQEESPNPRPFNQRFGRGFSGNPGAARASEGGLEGITPNNELLADALGIEVEELVAAQESAHVAWLAEMVANGYMDQEQADLMLAYQALKGKIDRHAIMASVLGLSEAELEAAREEGKNLTTLLEEQGLTAEELAASLETAYRDAVQALVPDVLTQDQADQILENGIGKRGFGGGMPGFVGGMRGYHGHGGIRGSEGFGSSGLNSGMRGFGFPGGAVPGSSDI